MPLTLTRPCVPKNLTEFGQTTYVQPPLWLFCNLAENDLFNTFATFTPTRSIRQTSTSPVSALNQALAQRGSEATDGWAAFRLSVFVSLLPLRPLST